MLASACLSAASSGRGSTGEKQLSVFDVLAFLEMSFLKHPGDLALNRNGSVGFDVANGANWIGTDFCTAVATKTGTASRPGLGYHRPRPGLGPCAGTRLGVSAVA